MIRAVIFDLGHTIWDIGPDADGLLDTAYADFHSRLAAAGQGPLPEPHIIRDAVSVELSKDAESYFGNGAELSQPPSYTWVARALTALGLSVGKDLVARLTPALFATETARLIVAPGTIEAVLALYGAGLRLGCVTNTLASGGTIEAMLELHGLHNVMDVVVVSSEEGVRKPHPRLFEAALSGVMCEAGEAVFVGDSPYHDVAGAKAVGMLAVQTTQYASRPSVPGSPVPDATIAHLRELLPLIDSWNRRR